MTDDDITTLPPQIQERYQDAGRRTGKAKERRFTKPCQHEGCSGWAWARGYCLDHYQKLKREGKLAVVRKNVGDPVARFHSKYVINPVTGCWEWTGWVNSKGYAMLDFGGKSKKVRASRFSWELVNGVIPEGLFALHRCDNRRCTNPSHLFLGTGTDNMRDCAENGRLAALHGGHLPKLTDRMVMTMRVLYARGKHSCSALAWIFNIDAETARKIVKGQAHL